MRKLKLFFACLLMAVLSIGQMWATPTAATLTAGTNGSAATVNSKAAIKVGTNKKSGDMTITVGAGATTLNLHAVAWNNAAGSIDLSAPTGVTLSQTSLSLSANSNISGTSTDYTIETEADYLFTITLSGVSAETEITLTGGTTSGKAKRFVVWEATYETSGGGEEPGGDPDPGEDPGEDPDPTDDADVTLNLLDEGWGFPTSKVVTETSYTNGDYTIKVAGNTGNGFRVYDSYFLMGQTGAYLELPAFTSPIARIVVAGNSNGSGKVGWNIYQGSIAVSTAATGCANESYTFDIPQAKQAANVAHSIKVTTAHNLQMKSIKIYFAKATSKQPAGLSYAEADLNKMTKLGASFTAPTLSNDNGLTVAYASNNTNVAEVNASTGEITIKAAGKAVITASSEETTQYLPGEAQYTIYVVEHLGTAADPYSVADARRAIDWNYGVTNVYAAGKVSKIVTAYSSQFHNITYNFSTDGTKEADQLQAFRGKGKNGDNFTSEDDVLVGDEVVVYGSLTKYGQTYEFAADNQLYSRKTKAALSWDGVIANTFAAELNGENDFPTLVNTNSVSPIAYTSSNHDVVEVLSAAGVPTLKAVGQTIITASFDGDENYLANSVSYTLNVSETILTGDISYECNGATSGCPASGLTDQTNLPENLPAVTKDGYNFGGWYKTSTFETESKVVGGEAITEDVTLYAKWNEPYTVAEARAAIDAGIGVTGVYAKGIVSEIVTAYDSEYGNISYNISSDGETTSNQLLVFRGFDKDGAWFTSEDDVQVGDEVVVYGNMKNYKGTYEFDANNQRYSFNRKASAGLAYEVAAVNKAVGDDAFINPLTNPYEVAVTYGTSDDQVAEVANDGTVTIKAKGSAIITASFAGNATYKSAEVSYTLTVEDAPVVLTDYYEKVTATADIVEGTYLIVYEDGEVAFDGSLETLDAASNTIDVEITNDNKIGVTSTTAASTFYIDPTAGTIQAKSGKYIGVSSNSNGLKTSDNADTYSHNFSIDTDGNAVIAADFDQSTMTLRYNTDSGQKRFRYYKNTNYPAIQLYKLANEVVKASPELTWSAESVELTVGDDFTSPTFTHADGLTETITFSSDKESVATVDANGVISLVADATGTAHITASYPGDANFKAGSAVCTIKINPAHSIYVDKLNVNFGSVTKEATVDDQKVTVTLTNVEAATATLGGSGASAFSITPAALTASGDITISVASTATAGTYAATITISDDASEAESKVVNLSLTVTEPEIIDDLSGTWVLATAVPEIGEKFIVAGTYNNVTKTMGIQNTNNRAAVTSSLDEWNVLTPGEGTKVFTLVDAGEGKYAIQASNGKYLTASGTGTKNYLTEAANYEAANAKWTISVENGTASVVASSNNRNDMQYNKSGDGLFACYATDGQTAIQLFVLGTPNYGSYQRNVTNGNYGTICLPKAGVISGATLFDIEKFENGMIYCLEVNDGNMEAGKPYIFQATSDQLNVVYSDAATVVASEANGLHGYYDLNNMASDEAAHMDLAQNDGNYILYQNQYWLVDGRDAYINNFRAYIKLAEIQPLQNSNGAPRRRVAMTVHGEQVATGIDAINASEKPMKIMIGGQMYILRGEKMYDATGRLVK